MFTYCPKCSSKSITFDKVKRFCCPNCNWLFYKNVVTAAIGILEYNGKILFQIRAKEPEFGKIDLPGGFVENNENAEEALSREIFEELGLKIKKFNYIGSAPNLYIYKGIEYNVCDLVYKSIIDQIPSKIDFTEVKEIFFKEIDKVEKKKIAFPSVIKALEIYKSIS